MDLQPSGLTLFSTAVHKNRLLDPEHSCAPLESVKLNCMLLYFIAFSKRTARVAVLPKISFPF